MRDHIPKDDIKYYINKTESLQKTSDLLNIPLSTLRRWCSQLGIDTKRYTHKKQRGMQENTIAIINSILDGTAPVGTKINSGFKTKLLQMNKLENACAICGLMSTWNNKPLILQLDHIDGNTQNNIISNLRLLCPNCHSQTHTYAGKNINGKNPARRICYDNLENIIKTHNPKTMWGLMRLMDVSRSKYYYGKLSQEIISRHIDTPILLRCKSCQNMLLTNSGKTGLCMECSNALNRKVHNRPSKNELLIMLASSSILAISKRFCVSDNTIRKWMAWYGIPKKKKEYIEYIANHECSVVQERVTS